MATPASVPPIPGDQTLARRLAKPIRDFMAIETASSGLLLAATAIALAAANSPWSHDWAHFWHQDFTVRFGPLDVTMGLGHWVNDALMAIFFFVVGLEIKREMTIGELASREKAMLPVFGALGGMVVPALLYLAVQPGGQAADGWGVPMATDIAFAVAALALLGRRVAPGLRVFLLALAIVDDLGAVAVIAVFYTAEINLLYLAGAGAGLGLAYLLRLAGVRSYAVYFVVGSGVWLATLGSGVHATVAGVLLGLLAPVRALGQRHTLVQLMRERSSEAIGLIEDPDSAPENTEPLMRQVRALTRDAQSPLEYLTHALHPWVAFGVMPIFALANAGVPVDGSTLGSSEGFGVALAIVVGLVLGKPVGIAAFSLLAVRLGIASLPRGVTPMAVVGTGFLGGIGFTMALFVTALAFGESSLASASKVGVLLASMLACAGGMLVLWKTLPPAPEAETNPRSA